MKDQFEIFFTEDDVKDSYRAGFWIGVAAGAFTVFAACFLAGVYFVS